MATLQPDGPSLQQRAQDQANGIVKQDADKSGVPVHTFDPDATPQQKAATAGKNEDQLKSVTKNKPSPASPGAKGMCFCVSRV